MERRLKKPKLNDDDKQVLKHVIGMGHLAKKRLEDIFKALKGRPEILDMNRETITDETYERYNLVKTKITVDLCAGGTWDWPIIDLNLLMQLLFKMRSCLFDAFLDRLVSKPCTQKYPWHLLIGFDEFTPGNKLKGDNRRKCMVLSVSFIELGPELLSVDAMWFTCVVVRHLQIENVTGGWSRMLRDYLKTLLLGPQGTFTVGVPFNQSERDVLNSPRRGPELNPEGPQDAPTPIPDLPDDLGKC